MSQWLSPVKLSSDLRYVFRHVNMRRAIVKGLHDASQSSDLWSVLLYGARGTSVSYAKEVLTEYLSQPADYFSQFDVDSPDQLSEPLRPSMPVLCTSLIHHVNRISATQGDTLSTLVDCIKEARRKKALLFVTDVDVLGEEFVTDDVLRRVVQLILSPSADNRNVPIVALYEKNWNYEADPQVTKRSRRYHGVRIGPYVPSRTGQLCIKYGLQDWLNEGAEFSIVPGSLIPSDKPPNAKELQDILEDVVALEDGVSLAWDALRRTSLPYLAVRLVDKLVQSVHSPSQILDTVLDAQERVADAIAQGKPDHPLFAAVMTASSQIEQMVTIAKEWQFDQRGRVLLPNGFPASSIPISRPLVTAWLFGSIDSRFDWPPAEWVRPRRLETPESGGDSEMEDSNNIRAIRDIGRPRAQ